MPIDLNGTSLRSVKLCVALWAVCALGCVAASSASAAVREPAPSIFSVNTQIYDSNHALYVRDIPTARAIGARWVHFTAGANWSRGTANFGALDYEVTTAKANGLGVLLSLGGIPKACSVSRPSSFIACPPRTSRELRTWAAFVKTLVLRYRSSVDTYESWLEPNSKSWWLPYPNPAQYATLLKTEYQVFRSVNRTYGLHLKLVFGGSNCFSMPPVVNGSLPVLVFAHRVLSYLHGARAFDAIGLHAYRYPQTNRGSSGVQWGPDHAEWDYVHGTVAAQTKTQLWRRMTWVQALTDLERQFAADGYPNMPMWLTEFGWPGVVNPGLVNPARVNLFPPFKTQARWLSQAYNDILSMPFIKAAFWFNLRDYQPGLYTPDPDFFRVMGLLQYRRTPKPAAGVFTRLAAAHPYR